MRSQFNIPDDAIVLGYVSRITENKGWRLFLDVIEILRADGRSIFGLIAGAGDEDHLRIELERRKLTNAVLFIGPRPRSTLPLIFSAMNVFMFTSRIDRTDTLGLVAVEALSCGVPVVALDTELTREYISAGNNGIFATTWTANAFAAATDQAISTFSKSEDERRLISQSAANYTSSRVAIELDELFKRTIDVI